MKMRCENCYGTLAEMLGAKDKKILELQAHVNQLHEAIRKIDFEYDRTQDPDMSLAVLAAMKLLDATPSQSLAEHDNELIERCAKVCEALKEQYYCVDVRTGAEVIRQMKVTP